MKKNQSVRILKVVCEFTLLFIIGLSPVVSLETTPASAPVQISETAMVIPTYQIGPPDPYPMFYTHESYQGAEKRVYPYPLLDDLKHVREDKTYKALNLENEYIQLTILPEIGGHLFSALDKTDNYNFFYRQHVIKPALIGMLGAWISGGVEWCAFHHHRNTTFMPIDYTLVEKADGSKTIWFGETERRQRMRWLIGISLYPGKSYLEATVKFFNRTPLPNSILYWANVAVSVNENYQVFFPPSVDNATFHSKTDFTHWPISNERYRGYDYKGVDISWWKNSPIFNSFFAWNLQEDFMGGYDHGKEAGVVHVGDHHIVSGAKLWEWGTGAAGRAWDKILTDEDGPYAELMVGAFSDNQPDYSWIKPHEVKTFKQYWYPIREIGGFKNANLNAAVNLELKPNHIAFIGFNTTTRYTQAKAQLKSGNRILWEQSLDIAPDQPFKKELEIPEGTLETDLRASLESSNGEELIAYQPVVKKPMPELPKTVKSPPPPQDIKTVEELYLTGLRVEQIHNPTVNPFDYYQEALKRDPDDSRTNTIAGMNYIKRGMYETAEKHLRTAIERITAEYTRPGNTEAFYYLGLVLKAQGKFGEAYNNFYRAVWDYAFHSSAYYQLAELSCRKQDFTRALEQVNEALSTNQMDTKAQNLKATILRKLERFQEAKEIVAKVLSDDPLDFLAMNERCLILAAMKADAVAKASLADLRKQMRDDVQSFLELAVNYMNCGLVDEAITVLQRPVEAKMEFAGTYPLVYYYLGFLQEQKGDKEKAHDYYAQAAKMPSDYCFPFRLESIDVLNSALQANPADARAYYYLGNLLFDIQPEKAMTCWEKSRSLDDTFALVHRNLGWVYYRIQNNITQALDCYEKALACNQLNPRLFLELDTLYETGNASPEKRLAALEKHHDILVQRVESFIREIMVLVLVGQYDTAIDYLSNHYFHVREGEEGIHDVYADAHLLKGLQSMKAKKFSEALDHFQKASEYPENLSVGKPENDPRAAEFVYYIGTAYEGLGNQDKALEFYKQATDQRGFRRRQESQYFQGLSLVKLGEKEKADKIFDDLIAGGKRRLNDRTGGDFFAKFGEQETQQTRNASAHFLLGLGYLGKGQKDQAQPELEAAVKLNQSQVWARYQLAALQE